MRISGPVTAYHFVFNKTRYYLLGDLHGKVGPGCPDCVKPGCWDILDWLDNQLGQGSVDFFLEQGLFSSFEQSGQLQRIWRTFRPCFERKVCPYKDVRAHYIDIRTTEDLVAGLGVYISKLVQIISSQLQALAINWSGWEEILHNIREALIFFFNNGEVILNTFLQSSNLREDLAEIKSPFLNLYLQPFLIKGNEHRIHRQLRKLSPKLRTAVLGFIQGEYRKTLKERSLKNLSLLGDWLKLVQAQDVKFVTSWFGNLATLRSDIVSIGLLEAFFMDAYTLGRILRDFGGRTKIVYAGAIHIERYVDFFISLGVEVRKQPLQFTQCSVLSP